MNFSNQQVDAITADVLRELRSRGVAVAAGLSVNPPKEVTETPVGDANLNDKVITEQSLIAADAAGRRISLRPGAVITPSGHDYIRRHGVIITSGILNKSRPISGTVIIVSDSAVAASAATAAGWNTLSAGCERDAASQTRKLDSNRVVCCGGEASVTACLLNRQENIRAAVVSSTTDVSRLMTAMQPNVLCLESGWAFSQLMKLLRAFSGHPTKPANWKELTG
ncbi:MAG: hypothetical protein R3C59_25100 [Planctomycetaceae bacterium]